MSHCAAACRYLLMAVLNSEAFGSTLIKLLLLGQGRGLWWSPTVQPYRSCAGTPIHPTAPFIGTFLTLHWTFSVSPASPDGGSSRGVEMSAISTEMAFGRTHLGVTGPLCNGCGEYWRCTKHNHRRTTLYVFFFYASTSRVSILLVNKGLLGWVVSVKKSYCEKAENHLAGTAVKP